MSEVSFLSALYVNAPPIPQQKLFENNVTTWVINFSEYAFSIPCKYPTYVASLNLTLKEVPSSTVTKITLLAFWMIFVLFRKNLWKIGMGLVCIKLINRVGFDASPPSRPYYPPPFHDEPPSVRFPVVRDHPRQPPPFDFHSAKGLKARASLRSETDEREKQKPKKEEGRDPPHLSPAVLSQHEDRLGPSFPGNLRDSAHDARSESPPPPNMSDSLGMSFVLVDELSNGADVAQRSVVSRSSSSLGSFVMINGSDKQ